MTRVLSLVILHQTSEMREFHRQMLEGLRAGPVQPGDLRERIAVVETGPTRQ